MRIRQLVPAPLPRPSYRVPFAFAATAFSIFLFLPSSLVSTFACVYPRPNTKCISTHHSSPTSIIWTYLNLFTDSILGAATLTPPILTLYASYYTLRLLNKRLSQYPEILYKIAQTNIFMGKKYFPPFCDRYFIYLVFFSYFVYITVCTVCVCVCVCVCGYCLPQV